jgi:hypothetical protein
MVSPSLKPVLSQIRTRSGALQNEPGIVDSISCNPGAGLQNEPVTVTWADLQDEAKAKVCAMDAAGHSCGSKKTISQRRRDAKSFRESYKITKRNRPEAGWGFVGITRLVEPKPTQSWSFLLLNGLAERLKLQQEFEVAWKFFVMRCSQRVR